MADVCAVAGDLVAFSVSREMDVRVELLQSQGHVVGAKGLDADRVDDLLRDQISVAAFQHPLQTNASVRSQVRLSAARCDPDAAVPEGGDISAQKVTRWDAELLLYGLAGLKHPCHNQLTRKLSKQRNLNFQPLSL